MSLSHCMDRQTSVKISYKSSQRIHNYEFKIHSLVSLGLPKYMCVVVIIFIILSNLEW